MTSQTNHYNEEALLAWMSGELEQVELEAIEQHLESCATCTELLESIGQPFDKFVNTLQSVTQSHSKKSVNHSFDTHGQAELDSNLLFGVLALQTGLIDSDQFVDACMLWISRRAKPLSEIMIQQNWITDKDRENLDALITRRAESNKLRLSKSKAMIETRQTRSESTLSFASPTEDRIFFKQIFSTGGIGQVWLAHDNVLGRDIAVKELLPEKAHSTVNRERLFREACITSQLTHPGIVPVYDFVDEPNRCYYTMKFLRGKTLDKVIAELYSQSNGDEEAHFKNLITLLNYFVSICNTLAYAHSRNIVHRDLKGENVIIGEYGEVTVLDWGIAKLIASPLAGMPAINKTLIKTKPGLNTIQGERLGTPAFMAPEQARGNIEEIDTRTDVYGLCAMLYEILTGRPPFEGDDIYELMNDVQMKDPAPPTSIKTNVPPELEAICLRGLSKKKVDRIQSAVELRDQIQSWMTQRIERKRIEDEREKFFNLSADLLGTMGLDGRFEQANSAWETLLGWSPKELKGLHSSEIVWHEDRDLAARNMAKIVEGGSLNGQEVRMLHRNGTYKWISWNVTHIVEEGKVYIVGRDITERVSRDARFAGLIESAPDATVVASENGLISFVNHQTEKMFGYSREELIGKPIEILIPERYRPRHPQYFDKYVENPTVRPMGATQQLFGRRKNGTEFPAEISLGPVHVGKELLIYSAVRDISKRVGIERQFAALLEAAPDAMVIVNQQGMIQLVNKQTEKIFGYHRDELLGKPIEVLIPPRFRKNHPEYFSNYVSNPSVRPMGANLKLFGLRKDGTEFPAEVSLSPLESNGETILVSSAIRDVTERVNSEKLFADLLEAAPDAKVIVNTEGKIQLINQQTERLFGYSRNELLNQPVEILIPERFRKDHPKHFREYVNNPSVRPMGANLKLFGLRKDGTEFPAEISLSPLRSGSTYLISSAIRDVSNRQR